MWFHRSYTSYDIQILWLVVSLYKPGFMDINHIGSVGVALGWGFNYGYYDYRYIEFGVFEILGSWLLVGLGVLYWMGC